MIRFDSTAWPVVVLTLLAGLCELLVLPASASTQRYVAQGTNQPDGQYLDWSTAASNIHDAVAVAASNDTIWIGAGVYTRASSVMYSINKPLSLRGWPADGRDAVILDGQGAYRTAIKVEQVEGDVLIEGLTVRNCDNSAINIAHETILSGTTTIHDCVITGNTRRGVYASGQSASEYLVEISGCLITLNKLPWSGWNGSGGYVRYGKVRVEDSIFASNTNILGSAAALHISDIASGNAWVRNCTFEDNVATNGSAAAGALSLANTHNALVEQCVFRNNRVGSGAGGIGISGGPSNIVRNCLLYGNQSANLGAGITIWPGAENSRIENCTIVSNTATNSGGGISYYVAVEIWNSIVYYNSSYTYEWASNHGAVGVGGSVTFGYSCSPGLPLGATGNIRDAPTFADREEYDFRLKPDSPCINKGTNQLWMVDARDLDHNRRLDLASGSVDMGCYEHPFPVGSMILLR